MEMAAEFAAISWTQVRRRSYESWSASIEPDTNIAACSADNLYFEAMEAMSDAEVVAYVKTAIDAAACGLRRAFSV